MATLADDVVGPDEGGIALTGPAAFPIADSTMSPQAVDTSPHIWSICLTHADKFDRALVESWKGDMDGILIFSGLFSAIVTAFLIDSYKALQPDIATANVNITAQLAIILARSTNQSEPVLPQIPQNSQSAYLVINALWFLSLSFSLTCAIVATLVQQWSRNYLQGTEEGFNPHPHQRVRMRTYLQRGVRKFHLSELVDAIPMLLHAALFLFFGGLLVFLFNLNTTLARILLILLVPALFIYLLLTALPLFFYDCPYKTPLTSILSYLTYLAATYRPKRRHSKASPNQWHPGKQTTHLTNLWSMDGCAEGAELDHTALRWTFVTLTEPSDLEQFVAALPSLLQSDSGTGFTDDGARAAQSLLFGPDMLAKQLASLLRSTIPSCVPAFGPADRHRLEARTVTCLNTVALLARACEGPTQASPHLWSAWATMYANPVARAALTLREQQQQQQQQQQPDSPATTPALAALTQGTALLLAWRALVAYRTFLADIRQRAITAGGVPAVLFTRFAQELHTRLSAGVYLARALHGVLHGLAGDPDSGIAGSALLAQRGDELLGGALRPYMPGAAGLGVGAGGPDVGALALAALADMTKAKECLALLFMYAACSLPADISGKETLRSLAAPLAWPEPCEYEEEDAAMRLLLAVRHAHGPDMLTVFDADRVVELYLSIHATPAPPH